MSNRAVLWVGSIGGLAAACVLCAWALEIPGHGFGRGTVAGIALLVARVSGLAARRL